MSQKSPDKIIYTDDAFEIGQMTGRLAATTIDRITNMSTSPTLNFIAVQIDTSLSSSDAPQLINRFADSPFIYGLEFTAIAAAIDQLRREVAGNVSTIFADNNAVLSPLIQGHTKGKYAHRLIASLWLLAST